MVSVSRLWSWCAHLQSQSLWCDHHHPVLCLKKQLLAYLWVWRFSDYFPELYIYVCVCVFLRIILDKNIVFMFHLGTRKHKWYKKGWTLLKLTLITDRLSWVDIGRLNSACWRWNDRFKVSHTCVWARLSLGATGQKGRDTRRTLNHQSALKSKPTPSSRRLYYRNVRERTFVTQPRITAVTHEALMKTEWKMIQISASLSGLRVRRTNVGLTCSHISRDALLLRWRTSCFLSSKLVWWIIL